MDSGMVTYLDWGWRWEKAMEIRMDWQKARAITKDLNWDLVKETHSEKAKG